MHFELDKVVIVGGRNTAGGLGGAPQPREENGGSGAELPTLRYLQVFPQKIRVFKPTLV